MSQNVWKMCYFVASESFLYTFSAFSFTILIKLVENALALII